MPFDYRYPTPLPSTKGWGPSCVDHSKITSSEVFVPGVHQRIAVLVDLLIAEMRRRGFRFDSPGCWGYACRPTKTSSGSLTGTPSFHGWGLAIDINAPHNVFGSARENAQLGQPENAWVVSLLHKYGFFWIGPACGDWMHFSFCGSPEDADRMTAQAKADFAPKPRYKVAGKIFAVLANAMHRVKKLLKQGKDVSIKVIK